MVREVGKQPWTRIEPESLAQHYGGLIEGRVWGIKKVA